MADDALERLKKRQRPNVPARDVSLTGPAPISSSVPAPINQNAAISISQDTSTPRYQEVKQPEAEEFKTKQTTMRLEQSISDRIGQICQQHSISREVLIEALFLHCEGDRTVLEAVVNEAQARHEYRTQIANRKRAQTMIEKFGG